MLCTLSAQSVLSEVLVAFDAKQYINTCFFYENIIIGEFTVFQVKEEAFLEALTSKRTVAGGETMVVRYKLADVSAYKVDGYQNQ